MRQLWKSIMQISRHPVPGEIWQAAQVNVSASALVKHAARQSSESARNIQKKVYSCMHEHPPTEVVLSNLVDFMTRGRDEEGD